MLTTKEFNGPEFHAFCQREYDTARRFLKTCGKPKNSFDEFMIKKHRDDVSIFGKMLDRSASVKALQRRNNLIDKRNRLLTEINTIDKEIEDAIPSTR